MALELVGGALLSSFLQVAFEKLSSPQVLDFCGRKLDETLLIKLKIKLQSIDALADDAEQRQFTDPRVREWLLEVKDVVLDAEDLLDEIHCELSRCEVVAESESQTCTGSSCKVPNFFKSSPSSSFNKGIKTRMEHILNILEFLSSQKDDLGLKNGSGVASKLSSEVPQISQSTSLMVESDIYGRDEDKKMIFHWLTSDNDNHNPLSMLSIVGMGGMGKTTLVQHVFNDPRMEEAKFDVKAWVCVSDDFDVFKVTRTILEAIIKSADDSRDLEMVHGRLKENLMGKKFLLVLDDVWNENRLKWEVVQKPLVFGAHGSRIIVTTRSKEVASIMRSKEHLLEPLQEDHCWKLFAKYAFQDGNFQPNPDCKKIGMQIVGKCKGLPLALKTMGSLLHNKSSVSEWKSILQSEIWEFSTEQSGIIPALALSYHQLPCHLKRCFAYCALFPKDYFFHKGCLIQLWMAENFLQCRQQSKSLEEVGEQYFNDLLLRSFFQEQSNIKGKRRFVMHDLLNDLAKYICGDICFRLGNDQAKGTQKTTRHLSVSLDDVRCFDGFGSLCDTKRLRTFMPTSWDMVHVYRWHCKMSINELFSKFKLLRVLSFSGCSNLTKVPDSVCKLKHLHSLDLSHTKIKNLTGKICSLSHLQILKLSYCENLEELPSNLHLLTNLRRLEFIDTKVRKVPSYLGKLKNLQVLMNQFDVGKSKEFSIQSLEGLNLVHRSLSINNLQNVENPSDALAAGFKNNKNLVELELEWNWDWNPDDSAKERDAIVIENLEPSKHLEKLSISNYGGKQFPNWLSNNSLSNMVSLKLDNCQSCQRLPSLGLLPFLKNLKISRLDGIVSIGVDFHGNSSCSFASLETLELYHMREWEKWECEAVRGAFPCLEHLSINKCPKLKGHLPEQLVPLKKLEIRECKQLEASAPRALKLILEDCGKLQLDWTTLKKLKLGGHSMEAWLQEMFGFGHIISNTCVEELEIYSCPKYLCDCEMSSDGCNSLKTFWLDFFPALRILLLGGFPNLRMISEDHALNHLQVLSIKRCPELESLPGSMHMLLPSLEKLNIDDCPRVKSFPEGGLPSNLKILTLYNCYTGLMASLKGVLRNNLSLSLETLLIGKLDAESFPDEGLLPFSLTCLTIYDSPNLKRLNYNGLCHLSSLNELSIYGCPNLQQLPDEGLPRSISVLRIAYNCPLLKERCQKPGGQDWPKIAHIQNLYI